MSDYSNSVDNDSEEKTSPSPAHLLEMALSGPDDALGKLWLGLYIRIQAQKFGISTDPIPEKFSEWVVEKVKTLEASTAGESALQKSLHLAAEGKFKKAGAFIREHLNAGANLVSVKKLARTYVPVGIRKLEQAKEFGDRGASENRATGAANKRSILEAAKKIIKDRKTDRTPTVRELAPKIAGTTKLSESTVRRHLTKARLMNIFNELDMFLD
jgi:hypothetical protein